MIPTYTQDIIGDTRDPSALAVLANDLIQAYTKLWTEYTKTRQEVEKLKQELADLKEFGNG